MYEGKTHNLFLRYAVPQMIGLLFNSVYTIVDGIFIGMRRHLSPQCQPP